MCVLSKRHLYTNCNLLALSSGFSSGGGGVPGVHPNWADAGTTKRVQLVANSRLLSRVSEPVGRSILFQYSVSQSDLGANETRIRLHLPGWKP